MSTNLATKIYVLSLTCQKKSAVEEFKCLSQHHSKRRLGRSIAETQVLCPVLLVGLPGMMVHRFAGEIQGTKSRLLLVCLWPGTNLCPWICGIKPETLSLGFFITASAAPETGRMSPGIWKRAAGLPGQMPHTIYCCKCEHLVSRLTQWWKSEIV